MITFALFSALSAFYFTMFFTPGPNNAMLTASGMKFGFVRTLPHLIGIPLGHIFQIGLTCFGLANLFLLYPQVQFYMKILCFIYLVYLGWKMIGSFSMVQRETGELDQTNYKGMNMRKFLITENWQKPKMRTGITKTAY